MKNLFYVILIPIVILSCSENGGKAGKNENSLKINFDSLAVFNPYKLSDLDNPEYYIVTYLNVSCPSCLAEIDKWDKLNREFLSDKVALKMICYSDDYFEQFKYLYENGHMGKTSFTFLLDTLNQFSKRNSIFLNSDADKTVLLNSDYRVVEIGSPIHDSAIMSKYKRIFQ